jgi:hypothetical protein
VEEAWTSERAHQRGGEVVVARLWEGATGRRKSLRDGMRNSRSGRESALCFVPYQHRPAGLILGWI